MSSALREAIEAVMEENSTSGMRETVAYSELLERLVEAVERVPMVPPIEGNGSMDGVTPILFFESGSRATFDLVGALYAADDEGQHVRITIDDGYLKWKVGEGVWCPGYPTERPNGGNG